jgi:hypothetical protein
MIGAGVVGCLNFAICMFPPELAIAKFFNNRAKPASRKSVAEIALQLIRKGLEACP